MPTKFDAEVFGRKIGRAIARDAIADAMDREWTGLSGQDGDMLLAYGFDPDSEQWDIAVESAREAFEEAISRDDRESRLRHITECIRLALLDAVESQRISLTEAIDLAEACQDDFIQKLRSLQDGD